MSIKQLGDFAVGSKVRITGYRDHLNPEEHNMLIRLIELGLSNDEELRITHKSLLNGYSIVVEVMGALIAMSKAEANLVLAKETDS